MATSKYPGPPEQLELYAAAVAGVDGMELKGATMPYTSRSGHMTSFLDRQGSMGLRLSPDDRIEFSERYDTATAVQHGKEMKDFVVVPADLLARTEEVGEWIVCSWEWVGTYEEVAREPRPSTPTSLSDVSRMFWLIGTVRIREVRRKR